MKRNTYITRVRSKNRTSWLAYSGSRYVGLVRLDSETSRYEAHRPDGSYFTGLRSLNMALTYL